MSSRFQPVQSADPVEQSPLYLSWLTAVAFVVILCLVVARAMMLEADHDLTSTVHGAGPTSALVLDLLCALMAMIPVVRRIFDPNYRLQLTWSHAAISGIATWMALSVLWAGNRFSAALEASHFIAGLAVLFAASQLVRNWTRVRLVAAILIGLLGAQICNGLMYRLSEWPSTVEYFEQNKAQILQEHGWQSGDFAARQFEHKLKSGELMGYTASPNSYAALLAMLCIIAMGWVIQKWTERQGQDWAMIGLIALAIVFAAGMIILTDSKAGVATPLLAVAGFVALRLLGKRLRAHARLAYWLGVALFIIAVAATIGHGLAHHRLFIESLTFRWWYWVGSFAMFKIHPWLGVGWGNFGEHYLHFRLPIASEQIKDPHDFFVRFATELGVVGLALAVAWMGRLWWELTRPTAPVAAVQQPSTSTSLQNKALMGWIFLVVAGGFGISLIAATDWSQSQSYILLELMRRGIYFAVMYILATIAAVRSLETPQWDQRPAPWILLAMILAAGLFLLHNLIDFSLFGTGPMMVFMLVAGSALGARLAGRPGQTAAAHPAARTTAALSFAVAAIAWLGALIFLYAPTADAEQLAVEGQRAAEARHYARAAQLMRAAFSRQPLNGDYAFQASQILQTAGDPPEIVIDELNRAIKADPFDASRYLQRAELELRRGTPDRARIGGDFRKAIDLDPQDMDAHLRFAQVLEQWNQPKAAKEQYQAALRINDALEKGDPHRLSQDRIDAIHHKIGQ